jgi:hypothetical protein
MRKKRTSRQSGAARAPTIIVAALLPILATAGPRKEVECKKILTNYERLRAEHRYLPPLFTAPAVLKRDESEPESELLEGLSIDNVAGATGDFNCKRDGTLDSIELDLLPSNGSDVQYKLSATRFAAVSTALIGAIQSAGWYQAEKALLDMMREATTRSKEALIRGDKYPEGSGSIQLSEEMTATLHLSAGGPSLMIDRSMAKARPGDAKLH